MENSSKLPESTIGVSQYVLSTDARANVDRVYPLRNTFRLTVRLPKKRRKARHFSGGDIRRDCVIGSPQQLNKYAVRQSNLSADKT